MNIDWPIKCPKLPGPFNIRSVNIGLYTRYILEQKNEIKIAIYSDEGLTCDQLLMFADYCEEQRSQLGELIKFGHFSENYPLEVGGWHTLITIKFETSVK